MGGLAGGREVGDGYEGCARPCRQCCVACRLAIKYTPVGAGLLSRLKRRLRPRLAALQARRTTLEAPQMRTWLTLPNLFTLARLLLAPVIVAAIFVTLRIRGAVHLCGGRGNRRDRRLLGAPFRAATATGAFLDPIADKLLLTGVYLALALAGSAPWWLVGVIFGRDLLILAASLVALLATKLRVFPPSIWGKASTFFQILTAVAFLGRDAFGSPPLATLSAALIWPTLALTVGSGVHYGWRGVRLLRAIDGRS